MGIRQFLLRGLEKVRTEWLWACTAYNLKKLTHDVAALRAPAVTGDGGGKLSKTGGIRDGNNRRAFAR